MYAANGELLSAQATTPLLVAAEREHGSLTRAALVTRRTAHRAPGPKRPAGGAPVFCTTADGMGGIVRAIEARLAGVADVRTGAGVTALERTSGGWKVRLSDEVVVADAVVVAAPAFVASELLRGVDPVLGDELSSIPFADTSVVGFVFPAGAVSANAGLGYVVPASEGTPVVACSVSSAKFPELVGDDHQVVRVYIGRHGDGSQSLSDDETLAIARRHVTSTLAIGLAPIWSTVVRIPAAFPQYVVGHRERVARIATCVARHPGLLLTGASYQGIGIPDCINAGRASAHQVLEYLDASGV
jgi:oxygen-dependent protoporphyrinogen oxidase